MTQALQRYITAFSCWIPDLSEVPERRRVMLAIAISLLINLIAIIFIGLVLGNPEKKIIEFAKPKLRARSIELTIMPPEPEPEPIVPFTLQKEDPPFMDSRGLDIAREAALHPIFQADENMRAASESGPTGDAPLPSQEGKDRPFNAFKTQRSLLGSSVSHPFPPAEEVPPLNATPPVAPPAPPVVAEQQPPTPPTPPDPKATATTPVPPPPSAEPIKAQERDRTDDIAMRKKNETDTKTPPATPAPAKAVVQPRPMEQQPQQAMLTTPAPKPQTARESGYQPEQEMNRIEGNISNRGKKSVDAVATPLAKFRKQVNDAIGSRWYYYVRDPQRQTLIAPGSARVSFFIDAQGQVVGIKLESNSSNESFAELCTSAVRDAREQIKDLKLPVDATMPLKDGRIECSLTFTFYNL